MNAVSEKTAIEKLLSSYGDALNAADTLKLLSFFSQEGILMPNGAPSAKGQEQLEVAYRNLLNAFKLNVAYSTDEIVVNGNYAYVRTSSKGKAIIAAKQETVPINNKELFVLQKVNEQWKISIYIFNNNQIN